MRKHKNKILALGFLGVLVVSFGAWRVAEAADSSIYVFPAQAEKEIGDAFVISVKVDPNGQKVCVVEGKLSLSKLSCQKITMGSGISAQSSPSCDDLSFLLGIQGCATSKKTLFTVTVKAENAGSATASFTEVDVIGEGVPISFVSSGGTYTISSTPPTSTPSTSTPPTSTPPVSTPSCDCGDWSSWRNGSCGGDVCPSIQRLQIHTRVCTPSGCEIEKGSRCVLDSSCIIVQKSEEAEEEETAEAEIAIEEQPIQEIEESIKEPEDLDQGFVEVEEESTEKDISEKDTSDILSKEVPQEILLASVDAVWWKEITQSPLLTVATILCLMGLAGIGAREWWLFRKKSKK